MTNKQALYLDLCKQGYPLNTISEITGRTPGAIMASLRKAVNKPCKSASACVSCFLRDSCRENEVCVERLSKRFYTMSGTLADNQAKGRYSY